MIYTVIEVRSLDPINWMEPTEDPDVREWDNMPDAMRFLDSEIDNETQTRGHLCYFIVEDGRAMSLVQAYRHHFGKRPNCTGKGYVFTLLRKSK